MLPGQVLLSVLGLLVNVPWTIGWFFPAAAFLAVLAISGPAGGRRLDTRPADAIALAVRLGAPLFVSDAVLEEAGTLLVEAPDEETIEEEVAEFRNLLDELDPAEIAGAIAELPAASADDLPGIGDPAPDGGADTDAGDLDA